MPWYRAPEYRSGREHWKSKRHWLTAQLEKLPKPLAVFTANDEQALDVLDSREASGLVVHKAFLEKVGRTPGQELQRVCIERAKRFLAEAEHEIEVIASRCVYQSANSFCVAFKQATGMSPKQYRLGFVH